MLKYSTPNPGPVEFGDFISLSPRSFPEDKETI